MKLKPNLLTAFLFLLLAPAVVQANSAPIPAPDFSAPDLSGVVHTLSSYRGKIVILNFWATWCPECIREIPSLNTLAGSNKDVVILSVASERDPEAVRKFLASTRVAYPVIVDATGDIFVRKYLVRVLPSTVIVDRNGFIAERIFGAGDFQSADFQKKIRRLNDAI